MSNLVERALDDPEMHLRNLNLNPRDKEPKFGILSEAALSVFLHKGSVVHKTPLCKGPVAGL